MEFLGAFWESLGSFGELFAHVLVFCLTLHVFCSFFKDLVGFLVRFSWADAGQKLGRYWAAPDLLTSQ